MQEFSCTRAGAACGTRLTAANRHELMPQISDHLVRVHHVAEPTETLLTYLASTVRETEAGGR